MAPALALPPPAGDAGAAEPASRHVAVSRESVGQGGDAAPLAARVAARAPAGREGTIITVANPKGGSGKSTIAMHLVVALLRAGRSVATADLDPGQWTFSRFLENRSTYAAAAGLALPQPVEHAAFEAGIDDAALSRLRQLKGVAEVVVIDTAGSITPLSRVAHALADILVTPINDSFIDLDLLASFDPQTLAFQAVSRYGDYIHQVRATKAEAGLGGIDWIVLRNRLTNLDARNKRDMAAAVDGLAERLGFRVGPGLSERTIYRELFLHGLTLSDLQATATPLTLSHVAARQELRSLLATVLPERAGERAPALAASA
jgi:chromosome partitioning protein